MKRTIKEVFGFSIIMGIAFCTVGHAFAEGALSDTDIVSKNDKIIINKEEECIELEQMPYFLDAYSMTTLDLLADIVSDDYDLSYADEDKNQTQLQYFTDGYVVAQDKVNPEKMIYIPIKMYKADETEIDFNAMYFNNQGGSSKAQKAGIGGKGSDEKAFVITPPNGGSTNVEGCNVEANGICKDKYSGAGNTLTWTAEFNIYAEGDINFFVHATYLNDNARTVFMWYPDGTVAVNRGGSLENVTKAERGQWHKIALSYSSIRHRVLVMLDGKVISFDNSTFWTDVTKYQVGSDKGAINGYYAMADGKIYKGYYYDSYYETQDIYSADESILIDDGTVWADISKIDTYEQLLSLIDAEKEPVITGEYKDGAKLVTVLGTDYKYYTVRNALFVDSINISDSGTGKCVSAVVCDKLLSGKTGVMIVSVKNSDTSCKAVYASEVKDILSEGTEFTIDNIEIGDENIDVIFITDWEKRLPLFGNIYSF